MMMVLIRSHDCHYGFFFVFFIFCVNSFPPHTWHNHTLFIHEGNAIYNMDWMLPIRQKDKKKINKDSKKNWFLVFKKDKELKGMVEEST